MALVVVVMFEQVVMLEPLVKAVPEVTDLVALEPLVMVEPEVTAFVALELRVISHVVAVMGGHVLVVVLERYVP